MQPTKSESRISGRTFIIILLVGAIVGVALVGGSVYLNAAPSRTATMTGKLFVSSAGALTASGPGIPVTLTYDVSIKAVSGSGTLNLSLSSKGADVLQQHTYQVTNFLVSPNNLTMSLSGGRVSLGWLGNTTVWKAYNDTYVGAWGPSAPSSQLRGSISPTDFPGISSGSYVVLSLSIVSQPSNNIPILVRPVELRNL